MKFYAISDMGSDRMTTTDTHPKYPNITVQLTGYDGNAFVILGTVSKALAKYGLDSDERSAFYTDATSGDYDHLLQTVMDWVVVE